MKNGGKSGGFGYVGRIKNSGAQVVQAPIQTTGQLADLIRGMGAHVNLIPINPVDGSPYSATDAANVRRFQQKLESLGVNATVRRRLGSEISAACGQLRRDEMNGKV